MKPTVNAVLLRKVMLLSALLLFSIASSSCDKSDDGSGTANGDATGTVTDTNGNPLPGVEIAIENTLVGYHSTANGVTGNNGQYRIKLPTVGTFHASAYLNKTYNGKPYKLALHCDPNDAFGNEGAVRDFQWKLTGAVPNTTNGFYGATLEFYNEPGYYIDEEDIVVTLTPVGALIDGSTGNTITVHPVVTSYAVVNDIPLGKYNVSATYNGMPLRLKKLDSEQPYASACVVEFEQEVSSGTAVFRVSYSE